MKKLLTALLFTFAFCVQANAACPGAGGCFWVGGTGTWDNASTTHWSASSGGANGAGPPDNVSPVTFDASSCAGACTITVAATINATNTIVSITDSLCTNACVLDFSANNPSITFTGGSAFAATGSGTRTITLGTGTFTFSTNTAGNVVDFLGATNLTWNNNTGGTWAFTGAGLGLFSLRTATTATLAFPKLTFGANPTGSWYFNCQASCSAESITVTGQAYLQFGPGVTETITTAFTVNNTSTTPVLMNSSSNNLKATINYPASTTLNWVAMKNIIGAGTPPTATNSFDLGGNTNITIQEPNVVAGGGGFIIGGG